MAGRNDGHDRFNLSEEHDDKRRRTVQGKQQVNQYQIPKSRFYYEYQRQRSSSSSSHERSQDDNENNNDNDNNNNDNENNNNNDNDSSSGTWSLCNEKKRKRHDEYPRGGMRSSAGRHREKSEDVPEALRAREPTIANLLRIKLKIKFHAAIEKKYILNLKTLETKRKHFELLREQILDSITPSPMSADQVRPQCHDGRAEELQKDDESIDDSYGNGGEDDEINEELEFIRQELERIEHEKILTQNKQNLVKQKIKARRMDLFSVVAQLGRATDSKNDTKVDYMEQNNRPALPPAHPSN
eukprot:Gb_26077 [translate_table: standard]